MTDGMNSFASTWFLLENEDVVGCHKGYIFLTQLFGNKLSIYNNSKIITLLLF